ncbi:GNAT family N-acetyltransferase [Hasllibacter sp. MH4015]|uniref:GNAT family N-acetyltransferase n=1 Tax=Hasllibacter sp. MH4015 TaxID=2854029 RepID=UPI001CD6FF19|nr:GNAT family N-acetyltransferase [Hasllibacter sp. MH4015]
MNDAPVIRRAEAGDMVVCAEMTADWIASRDWARDLHTREAVLAFYTGPVFETRETWVFGASVDGFYSWDADAREVTALMARRPGRGVGKALLDHAKATHGTFVLYVMQANRRAWDFYLREGLREVSRTDGDNEEGLPDVLMRWAAA